MYTYMDAYCASAFGNDERIKCIRPLFFSSSLNAIAGNPNPLSRFPCVFEHYTKII